MVLEKTLESLLDSTEIKPVNPKVNEPWIFIERIDAEVEVPILWPPDVKNRLTGKNTNSGKDWGQVRRGRRCQRMRRLDGIIDSVDTTLSEFWDMVKDREVLFATIHEVTKIQTWLNNSNEYIYVLFYLLIYLLYLEKESLCYTFETKLYSTVNQLHFK